MDPSTWLVVALCVAVILLFALWRRADTRVARHNRARQRAARIGEEGAEQLLYDAGYRVIDRQVTRRWWLHVDGEPREVSCRADLLVEARSRSPFPRGARLVAEVKTGQRAPDPTHPGTRRQLMEYSRVFDVAGVLLVDMERGSVQHVEFRDPVA